MFQNLYLIKMKAPKNKVNKTFKQAVEATLEVHSCFSDGKQAIKHEDRDKVELADPRKCGGSLFIDKCLFDQNLYHQANRWDYAIDYNGETFFFEVHPAITGQVVTVISKLHWLRTWLMQKAPEINKLKTKNAFHWVQTKGCHILPNSSQARAMRESGLKPVSKLVLK